MEYLDPKKRQAHLIRLFIGYVLIGMALVLTTIILLYQAYGFGLKNGQVIQNGLVFISSSPVPADIYVNGSKREEVTNTRLLIPAGKYSFELRRDGYRSWKRAISLEGGAVQRLDYPMLFPTKLDTQTVKNYSVKPLISTQSPDRRWLMVQTSADYKMFDLFDTTKPDKEPVAFALPPTISSLTGTHSWKLIEWANDNVHVLLQHTVDNNGQTTSEYILANREKPAESVNISTALGVNPLHINLQDKKYDKYIMMTADRKLQMATLGQTKPVALLDNVLEYKTYGEKTILYATTTTNEPGKVAIRLQDNDRTYDIRTATANSSILLDIAKYDGDWFVAAGAASENKTYIYKNPMTALNDKPTAPLVPVQVLKTVNPNHVSFSGNTRFIMTESGQNFSVYDAEYDKKYAYATTQPLDAPQSHAEWMDGHRLAYISGGKLVVFDYDNTNSEMLVAADPQYGAFFNRSFEAFYSLVVQPSKDAAGRDTVQYGVTRTPLRTPADL